MPAYFKNIDLDAHLSAFEPLAKEGRIYVAPFSAGPLTVQTPPLLVAQTGETFLWTQPSGPFRAFLQATEEKIRDGCLASAEAWGITTEQVTTSFKSFFREDDSFKVRLASDFSVFDEQGELANDTVELSGRTVRGVLELSRVCLGKTEMGAIWKLLQVRLVPEPPPCLIDLDIEVPDDHEDSGDHDGGDEEFV